MVSFISILLSFNAVKALVPVIIIGALIAAAAGLSRGKSLFSLFGVGTVLGSAGGVGSKVWTKKDRIEKQKVKPEGLGIAAGRSGVKNLVAARAGSKIYKNEIHGKRVNANRSNSLFNTKDAAALGIGSSVTYIGEMPKRIGFAVAREKEIATLKKDKGKAAIAAGLIQTDKGIRGSYDELEKYRTKIANNSIKLDSLKSKMNSRGAETVKKNEIEYRNLKKSQKKMKMDTIKLVTKLAKNENAFMIGGVGLGLLNRDDVIDIHRHLDAQIESLNSDVRIGNYGVYNKISSNRLLNIDKINRMVGGSRIKRNGRQKKQSKDVIIKKPYTNSNIRHKENVEVQPKTVAEKEPTRKVHIQHRKRKKEYRSIQNERERKRQKNIQKGKHSKEHSKRKRRKQRKREHKKP